MSTCITEEKGNGLAEQNNIEKLENLLHLHTNHVKTVENESFAPFIIDYCRNHNINYVQQLIMTKDTESFYRQAKEAYKKYQNDIRKSRNDGNGNKSQILQFEDKKPSLSSDDEDDNDINWNDFDHAQETREKMFVCNSKQHELSSDSSSNEEDEEDANQEYFPNQDKSYSRSRSNSNSNSSAYSSSSSNSNIKSTSKKKGKKRTRQSNKTNKNTKNKSNTRNESSKSSNKTGKSGKTKSVDEVLEPFRKNNIDLKDITEEIVSKYWPIENNKDPIGLTKRKALLGYNTNKNAFYYRLWDLDEREVKGWTAEYHKLLMEAIQKEGKKWGIVSTSIEGKVGYTCSQYWKKLIKKGYIDDANYYIERDSDGKMISSKCRSLRKPKSMKTKDHKNFKRFGFRVLRDDSGVFNETSVPKLGEWHPKAPSEKCIKASIKIMDKMLLEDEKGQEKEKQGKERKTDKKTNKSKQKSKQKEKEMDEETKKKKNRTRAKDKVKTRSRNSGKRKNSNRYKSKDKSMIKSEFKTGRRSSRSKNKTKASASGRSDSQSPPRKRARISGKRVRGQTKSNRYKSDSDANSNDGGGDRNYIDYADYDDDYYEYDEDGDCGDYDDCDAYSQDIQYSD